MQDNKLVLGYWAGRGLAQPINYLLQYLELPYEEKKYASPEEWFGGDVLQEPFNKHNLVNLPYIKDGDQYIYESQAIPIYLAHKANKPELLGRDAKEQVISAQVRGVLQDIKKNFVDIMALPKEEFAAKVHDSYKNEVAWLLVRLNNILENKTYATGENINIEDFQLFEVEELFSVFQPEHFEELKNLKRHHQTIANLPKIKAYQESKGYIARPFFGGFFQWG